MTIIARVDCFEDAVRAIRTRATIASEVFAEPYPRSPGTGKTKPKKGLAGPEIMAFTFLAPDRTPDGELIAVGCYMVAAGTVHLYDQPTVINENARTAEGAYRVNVAGPGKRRNAK